MDRRICCVLSILAVAFALPAAAQFAHADLAGTVTDTAGAVLSGVTVVAANEATGIARRTVTAANGRYAIHGLKPGTYTVTFELEGFPTVEQPGVPLRVGQETLLDATMPLGVVEDTLTVSGDVPLVELTSKELGGILRQGEVNLLPSKNRSTTAFAGLMPGVVPSPSSEMPFAERLFVHGQDDNNNAFFLDGANNDDDVVGSRAGAQVRTPIEAIQELQVLTSQFDAEFGRTVGGVLNAVTKSGGNQLSGVAFAYFQDAALDQKSYFADDKPDTSYRSLGFAASGPVVRDKAHFFVSYEDGLIQEGKAASFRERSELDYSTTEDNDVANVLVKLDYQPTAALHLAGRYLLEESRTRNQAVPVDGVPVTLEAVREEDDADSNVTFSAESVHSERAFNTLRLSYTLEDVCFGNPGFNGNGQDFAAQRGLAPIEEHPGFVGGASTMAETRINRSAQADDTFSLYLPGAKGEHELRFGFQYSEREEEFTDFGAANGDFFAFDDDRPFDPGDVATYPGAFNLRVLGGQTAKIPKNETVGLFAQDDWRIRDKVTLSLGLRYDEESITAGSYVAPRLGFTWDPFDRGKTVVRGGYGRFYGRFLLGYHAKAFLDSIDQPRGFLLRFPDAGFDTRAFFDLAQAHGATTLGELRDVLAILLEGAAVAPINSRPTVTNSDRGQSYADSLSLGVEHELRPGWALGADLVHVKNRDVPLVVDLNPPSLAQGGRPDLSVWNGEAVPMGSITTWVNAAESDYTALQLQLQHRGARLQGRVSYTYAVADGNHEGGGRETATAYFQTRTETGYDFDRGVFLGEPVDLNLDDPRARGIHPRWHRDHNLAISGSYLVPGTSWRASPRRSDQGLEVAWIYRYMTGDYVTLLRNDELLDNGNRAPAPAGDYGPTQSSGIGRNVSFNGKLRGAENPGFSRLDLSLRYRIPFGDRLAAILVGDVFNLFDEANFTNLGGGAPRAGTGSFLTPNAAYGPRQVQLGVRFEL